MQAYKVGDKVVHWIYGVGTIVAIEDKGTPGEPCNYYVIQSPDQTLWVPVHEDGRSSLHPPTSRLDFNQLFNILQSQGDRLSENPFQRVSQLEERMQKASPKDICLVIRDLTYRSHRGKLNSSDTRVLNHAQSFLTDEWELSLGTPREKARQEMEGILKDTPAIQNTFP